MRLLAHIQNLSVRYGSDAALNNLDLDIYIGETLAIIGESGSGKSTMALALADLLPASAQVSGLLEWSNGKPTPGRDVGFVFQDPVSSFDPLMSIGAQLVETIRAHENISRHGAKDKAINLLSRVQIAEPELSFVRYPHQFSGGQKQRIAIALAIAASPNLLIADEPTSALDTIVQREIVELLRALVQADAMTLIFITHDIALASNLADRVAVFRHGELVESGSVHSIITNPMSDYTKALISAVPVLDPQYG
ncbi:ABC transporter ATP-binding protein [Brucella sp. NBRC 12950]|uniref:ATP-binding cassette domain-containing protein n=1 Tax=Brucella sp. NBRC 12950 TaxID=2994518 RepID=UPI0024A08F35|nr:ABC transporter ATP-binding protein [Brucella sp. NBRC 12950]GLU25577.1 ABC transporter ATP-binding protein [Brucella sp. NBRC 12950]